MPLDSPARGPDGVAPKVFASLPAHGRLNLTSELAENPRSSVQNEATTRYAFLSINHHFPGGGGDSCFHPLSPESSCLWAPLPHPTCPVELELFRPPRSAPSRGQRWARGGRGQRTEDTEVLPSGFRGLSPAAVTQGTRGPPCRRDSAPGTAPSGTRDPGVSSCVREGPEARSPPLLG